MADKTPVKFTYKEQHNTSTGEPIMCDCGSKEFRYNVIDRITMSIVCEEEKICTRCSKIVGYWAYGSWDSNLL
jgi:hypothetical protein